MNGNGRSPSTLEGKVAIVTGSTQGLGEACVRLFAERGIAGVVVTGRDRENGEAVAADVAKGGTKTKYVQADLADLKQVRAIAAAADKEFGRVDILVNSAGITDRGTIFDTSPELYERMMAINVRAPFFLIQDCAKIMRREKIAGAMVNIQSMSANGGQPFLTPYSVSKGALATLTKNAAFSLMPWRIRVNGLNLGWMDTPGEDRIMKLAHNAKDGWLEKAEAEQPFGRLIKTEEAARTVAYLASEESGMLTGANIDFDQSVIGCYESAPHPSARP